MYRRTRQYPPVYCRYDTWIVLVVLVVIVVVAAAAATATTERHLPYEITQCYLPSDTGERALP